MDEVRGVVWSTVDNKVLGPDGSSLFKRYQVIICQEVICAIQQFFDSERMLEMYKRIFIMLNPKYSNVVKPATSDLSTFARIYIRLL